VLPVCSNCARRARRPSESSFSLKSGR
jgi:hypothetical protein